ncbi:uncharacterized protein LOC142946711 [Anarhichas minor]|uniref:uncharacterized protein LOC142946711 n=1 Tax=Anarhichas minor TaxID=65739 RepID=UPI003F7347BA
MLVIGVSNHKTATISLATFALTQEEEAWFQAYYEHIRPSYISALHPCDRFFISGNGKALHSVTNDVARLHEKYKVSNVTSHDIRRIAETEANSTFTTAQKEGVARYMAHSSEVAKSHYRMPVPQDIVRTAVLLATLSRCSSQTASQTAETCPQPQEPAFDVFKAAFPVTNDGHPPSKKQRMDAGFSGNRSHYDRWGGVQYIKRGNYLLSHFLIRKPSAGSVSRLIAKEGWQTNHPSAEDIVKMWKPASRENVE